MHGTLSDEHLLVPGESVVFVEVWLRWLVTSSEWCGRLRLRGYDDTLWLEEYKRQEARIDTYLEALSEGGHLWQLSTRNC